MVATALQLGAVGDWGFIPNHCDKTSNSTSPAIGSVLHSKFHHLKYSDISGFTIEVNANLL